MKSYHLQQYTPIMTILALWLLVIGTLQAQSLEGVQSIRYSKEQGLPQCQVTRLMQDSRGYIWAGTKAGVGRFDGVRFHPFTASREGLSAGEVVHLEEDEDGFVWIITTQGVSRISGDSVQTLPVPLTRLYAATLGGERTLWYAKRDASSRFVVGRYAEGRLQETPLSPGVTWVSSPMRYDKLHHDLYLISSYDGSDRLLRVTREGRIITVDLPKQLQQQSKRLLYGPRGEVCIAFSREVGTVELYALSAKGLSRIASSVGGRWVEPLPIAWYGVSNVILPGLHLGELQFLNYGELINLSKYISQWGYITDMVVNQQGGIYLGTERGMLQVLPDAIQLYDAKLLPEVWGCVAGDDGTIYASSFTHEIKRIRGDQVESLSLTSELDQGYYFHPVRDSRGVLYFPHSKGVIRYNPKSGKVSTLERTGVHEQLCFYTYYDAQRRLIWGGGMGSFAIWDEEGKVQRTVTQYKNVTIQGNILSITRDSVGSYWLGGREIYRYDYDTGALVRYANERGDSYFCMEMATDAYGTTWFATDLGLCYYDAKQDQICVVDDPEFQELTALVLPIDSERLLVSQGDRLCIIDLKAFHHTRRVKLWGYIDASNGFRVEEPGQAGAYMDSQGNIWVASSSQLASIRPKLLRPTATHGAKLFFSYYNNTPILYNQRRVSLPTNRSSVTISLTTLAYSRPYPLVYRYRTSSTAPWSKPQDEDYIVLTDLPHGTTTLQVQVLYKGTDKVCSEQELYELEISVRRAFYNQVWFVPSIVLLLLLAIVGSVLLLLRTKRRLSETITQAQVAEMDTIQAQLNPHFVYNVLTSVQAKVHLQKTEEAEQQLVSLSRLIRAFLHSSIQSSVAAPGDSTLAQHWTTLQRELELTEQFVSFQQELHPDAFAFQITIEEAISPDQVCIPPMLLQPFVENAISHGLLPLNDARRAMLQVSISLDQQSGAISIQIADNGIGIQQAQKLQHKSKLSYHSYGLELTKKRIHLLNRLGYAIDLGIDSSEQGTTITLCLPPHYRL